MTEKQKGILEEVAEETGKLIGKGAKKGIKIAKAFEKGLKDSCKKKEE